MFIQPPKSMLQLPIVVDNGAAEHAANLGNQPNRQHAPKMSHAN
ncbi:hypothetical protein [Herpetosiphon llansteffanensis]|nr:hypothetical protein [Herpetosiphon llansteffanensis]